MIVWNPRASNHSTCPNPHLPFRESRWKMSNAGKRTDGELGWDFDGILEFRTPIVGSIGLKGFPNPGIAGNL
ncbi:unnamed protein product [Linum trigynum]|uniref:Uncharacterized protein n=1 Tax=Linum trigynum TaxID=586398 RepID=A0AAV2E2G8_9ROSI